MARTANRGTISASAPTSYNAMRWRLGKYIRLSKEDLLRGRDESNSVINQRRLLEQYHQTHLDEFYDGTEQDVYVDDGKTGTDTDREDFQRLLADVYSGRINCVIVKDLSRLGREYIETGRYLRQIFPAYGVRFIAINDGIDTANEHNGDDLNISLKNLLNDTYCRDISVKTRSALLSKRKNGEYVGACPVYGYRKDQENKNQLVIDEDTARVVRDIFRRRIDGASAKRIADELNRLGIPSPLAYKISRGLPHPKKGYADSQKAQWSAHTVLRILQDETYTGVLLQGKQSTHNHKIKDIIEKPAEEWIRTENAHAPIIRKQDYELVQKIMGLDTRTAPDGDAVYLFSGILICRSCGGRMTRKTNTVKGKKYIYYHCPTGKKHGCEHPTMLREDELTACVLESLQAHIRNVVSLEKLLDSISEEQINQELIAGFKSQIAENEVQLEKAMQFKAALYENFVSGFLDKKEYRDLKNQYTAQIEQRREAIESLRKEMEQASANTNDRLRWTQHFKEFSTMTSLDRRAVITLIQCIHVEGKNNLKITFRYQLEYQQAKARLETTKEAV